MSRPERQLDPGRSALDRFGYEIRKWRKARGLSLERAGALVHVSGALVQRIEIGERRPAREFAVRCDGAFRADGAIIAAWEEFSESEAQRTISEYDAGIPQANAGTRTGSEEFPGSRNCARCERPLSRYNKDDYCGPCSATGDWGQARSGDSVPDAVRAEVAARLRAARMRRGMSLDTLAGLAGFSASFLSMVETGKRNLDRYSTICAVASALGIPPSELAPGLSAPDVPKLLESGPQKAHSEIQKEQRMVVPRPQMAQGALAEQTVISGEVASGEARLAGPPNLVLRGIRENERQETRAEFAEAMRCKAIELGENVAPTERVIARLELGEVRYPHPPTRRVLTALCGRSMQELGFTRPVPKPASPAQGPTLMRVLIKKRHLQNFERFRVQFERAARELSARDNDEEIAKGTVSMRQYERWYSGQVKTEPHPDSCRILEYMLGYSTSELMAPTDEFADAKLNGTTGESSDPTNQPADRIAPPSDRPSEKAISSAPTIDAEDIELERRNLLQNLGVLGVASAPAIGALDYIRRSLGTVFDESDRNHLDDWENAVAEYGYSYLNIPPAALIPDLAADIVAIRTIAADVAKGSGAYRGWQRVAAAVACLMAKSFSNLGKGRESRQWWNMAEHLSDSSGDIELNLWVRGERIVHGLYEHRAAQMLLTQVKAATEHARGHTGCAGFAHVATAKAQALVLAGNYEAAERELGRASHVFAQLPSSATRDSSSVMSWGRDRLHYTETWVYSHTGNYSQAAQAAEKALRLYPTSDDRTPTQIKLLLAFSLIRTGDVAEGLREALTVYGNLTSEQHTNMVDALAQQVMRNIPDRMLSSPDGEAYRALVTSSSKAIEP